MTVVRNGRLIDIAGHLAPATDILIDGDSIAEIGPPGLAAPADAAFVDASDRLIHPGLINAHTHGHGNLSKGMGDRWTLELLLTAGPWISGNRTVEYRERYWDPIVHVRGSIAVVWTPYEFWTDGKTSHCGIDVFEMMKDQGAWKIANMMWTVEPDACAALRPADPARIRPAG